VTQARDPLAPGTGVLLDGQPRAAASARAPLALQVVAIRSHRGASSRDASGRPCQWNAAGAHVPRWRGSEGRPRLIIDVGQWEAAAEVREAGTLSAVQLNADARSLQVREGLRGIKPLTDKNRGDIRNTIDEKSSWDGGLPLTQPPYRPGNGGLTVRGELELAGVRRPAGFELDAAADGRVRGTLPVTQSEWGIKPYRGLMGALKVRATVEVVLDVAFLICLRGASWRERRETHDGAAIRAGPGCRRNVS
jgi:hypothetical protein